MNAEWVQRVVEHPVKEVIQQDGRIGLGSNPGAGWRDGSQRIS